MALASRHIQGLPYAPGMATGRYPNAAWVGTTPGVTTVPGGGLRPIDSSGQAVRVVPVTAAKVSGGGSGGGGGLDTENLLLAAGLGLLPYLPDAIDAVSDLFGGGRGAEGCLCRRST